MRIHELPWPKEMLLALGSKQVQMKVTLSYFIKPRLGEKGWENKYRYPSSLLRFQVNGSDSKEEFLSRINKASELDTNILVEVVMVPGCWEQIIVMRAQFIRIPGRERLQNWLRVI